MSCTDSDLFANKHQYAFQPTTKAMTSSRLKHKHLVSGMCQLWLLLLTLPAWSQVLTQTITTRDNNRQRQITYYVPAGLGANAPLLLCYHGSGGTSTGVMQSLGFNALADKYKFIVCYPQSLTIGSDVQWNVYVDNKPGHGGVGDNNAPDDVIFTEDIISYLHTERSINTKQVYATGISNGGFMCYMLAVSIPDKIPAIAPVAGNMWGDDAFLTQYFGGAAFKSVRVLHSHGTADQDVDYPDKNNNPDDFIYPLASFSSRMCSNTRYSVTSLTANVDKLTFCAAPDDVVLIRQKGLGHAWSLSEYDLSTEIARFFGLTEAVSKVVENTNNELPEIRPQPVNDVMLVRSASGSTRLSLRMYNTVGECVIHINGLETETSVDVSTLCPGLYSAHFYSGASEITQAVIVVH